MIALPVATTLGHIHLKVRDLEVSVPFYCDTFGLRVQEKIARFVFLTGNEMHHTVALQEIGAHAAPPQRQQVGLYHVAFEVASKAELARSYRQLRAQHVDCVAVDHRISWAIYFFDPDHNGLEIYCDTRAEPDGVREWEGVDRPLEEERLLKELKA